MAGDIPTKQAAAKPPAPKVFNCPSCGAGILIRALGQSVSVACRSCGSVMDAKNENYQVISRAAKQLKIEPLIPLGQRGKLHGVLWEVIGFMQRCDGSGVYSWGEYLLFNPVRGFRWLTEFDGHWNYIVGTKEKPSVSIGGGRTNNLAKYMGKTYSLFHKGTAKVTFVVGEFYWRVKVDEKVKVEDFVAPPEILSCEKSKDEVIWSVGEYLDPNYVRSAFQITKPMPIQSGVAPNQPSTLSSLAPSTAKYWGIFIAIIFAVQFFGMTRAKNEQAYRGHFTYRAIDKSQSENDFNTVNPLENGIKVNSRAPRGKWNLESISCAKTNFKSSAVSTASDVSAGRTKIQYIFSNGTRTELAQYTSGNNFCEYAYSSKLDPRTDSADYLLKDLEVKTLPSTPTCAQIKLRNDRIMKFAMVDEKTIEMSFDGKSSEEYCIENGELKYRITKDVSVEGNNQVVSPQFELKHGLSNVDFRLYAPVQNNWLELQVDLVNDQTGETSEFEQGIEYYSGYDSDGSWSEGSQTQHITLSSIPDGLYHLNIEANSPTVAVLGPGLNYSVTVTRDVVTWSNFLWAMALLSILPAFVWWRSRSFEQARWSTSDFSPYWSQSEED